MGREWVSSEDARFMRRALEEAEAAFKRGEVPVGAVLVLDGEVLAAASNSPRASNDPTAHAEVLALREGARRAGNYRLPGSVLYVTLEPCPMCVGAMLHARVARLVYGAKDPKAGAVESLYRLAEDTRLNHRIETQGGLLAEDCGALLKRFFEKLR
jgi:tRNA(adenine34) deaminase